MFELKSKNWYILIQFIPKTINVTPKAIWHDKSILKRKCLIIYNFIYQQCIAMHEILLFLFGLKRKSKFLIKIRFLLNEALIFSCGLTGNILSSSMYRLWISLFYMALVAYGQNLTLAQTLKQTKEKFPIYYLIHAISKTSSCYIYKITNLACFFLKDNKTYNSRSEILKQGFQKMLCVTEQRYLQLHYVCLKESQPWFNVLLCV